MLGTSQGVENLKLIEKLGQKRAFLLKRFQVIIFFASFNSSGVVNIIF